MNETCKICGTKTQELVHKKLKLRFYFCNHCEFIAKDKNAIITLEEELQIYNNHNNSIEDPKYVAYFKDFIDQAVLKFHHGNRFGLDFGSGPSPVLAMVLKRDYGFSMDIYDKFYAPEKVYNGKSYDLITSTEVVEHLKNPMKYFQLFKNLVSARGIISVMTLFHPRDHEQFLDWFYIRDKSHISFYTPITMKYIGEKLGLQVIYTNDKRYTTFAPIT